MYYISKAPTGGVMVSTEPPENEYFEVESLPEGDGELKFGPNNTIYLESYPAPNIPQLRSSKETEISQACHAAIIAGMDVTLSDGTTGHFSLEETDQINLTTAYNAIQNGADGYPYHADGELCKMYSAVDIIAIADAATEFKLYHLTYCNHMLAWVRRAETVEELQSITYGATLPNDLAANMADILGGGQA